MGNIQEYGLKFSYSQQLPEKPINVLIPRDELENMSVLTVKYNNGLWIKKRGGSIYN